MATRTLCLFLRRSFYSGGSARSFALDPPFHKQTRQTDCTFWPIGLYCHSESRFQKQIKTLGHFTLVICKTCSCMVTLTHIRAADVSFSLTPYPLPSLPLSPPEGGREGGREGGCCTPNENVLTFRQVYLLVRTCTIMETRAAPPAAGSALTSDEQKELHSWGTHI